MVMFPHFLDHYGDQKVINKHCVQRTGTNFCLKLMLFNTVKS